MSPFEGSDNKSLIRLQWDLPIIQKWAERMQRPLSYFGLPGPKIKDVLAWKEHLGVCTGVERLRNAAALRQEDLNIHRQLLTNVAKHDLEGFQLMRGNIEDVILQGADIDRARPKLSNDDPPLISTFRYDLINLDFLGGMGAKDRNGESKRVRAIKKVIERQRRSSYILIITINVRDGIDSELDRYLIDTSRNIYDKQLSDTLIWYKEECREGRKDYRLKAVVPLFIRSEVGQAGAQCFCLPPLSYEGDGRAKMVHFIFEITHTQAILPAYSDQTLSEVINLPLITVKDHVFHILSHQHPGFDYSRCEQLLCFLPEVTKQAMLSTIPSSSN